MKLVSLSALSALVASASAADCFGSPQKGITDFAQAYWDARAEMCSNQDCGYQKECTTTASKKIKGLIALTVNVSITRKYTGSKKGFGDCWDATNDIINQCVYGENKLSGTWSYNGQLYEVDSWYS